MTTPTQRLIAKALEQTDAPPSECRHLRDPKAIAEAMASLERAKAKNHGNQMIASARRASAKTRTKR